MSIKMYSIVHRAFKSIHRPLFDMRHLACRQAVSTFDSRCSSSSGFSLVELLLAVTVLIIALVPAMDSITASLQYAAPTKEHTSFLNIARQKMEDVLAMSFDSVPVSASSGTPTALSDTVTVAGKTVNRLVLVDLYDGDGDSVPDSDLKKVTVIVKGVQYKSLMANHY